MTIFKKFRLYLLVGLFLSLLGTVFLSGLPTQALVPANSIASALSMTEGVQKTVLDNGLTVVTKEVHTAPVVSVQVWYRVGSRNEPAGENGISHQLEHLMFKGTTERPIQFGRFFSALGSQSNAFTSYDMTAYYGTVERDKLEAMLVLEADRLENSVIGNEQLESEKRVVISELQGYENSPRYRLDRAVLRAAFPDHPYGLPVGGTRSDVESFTVEAVQRYYQTYYTPDNAILVITGDFETDAVLPKVQEIFGQIAKRTGNAPSAGVVPVSEVPQSPIVLQEPGSAALLQIVYPIVDINNPDVPAIDLMDAILTGGRSARLYQALVESGLASSLGAYAAELIEPGWYEIYATVAPGQSVEAVDRVVEQSITQFREQGVTEEELDRAKTLLKTYLVLSNQDITSQASQLGYYETVTGDYQFSDRYLAAIDQVTTADVQRVAQTYLDPAKRTVGYFEPTLPDGSPGSSGDSSSRIVENFNPGQPVDPAEVAQYLPPITEDTRPNSQPIPEKFTIDNGLEVLLLPDSSTPMINLSGWVESGASFDTEANAGLANLTANNLLNGTQSKDALTIAKTLEDEGASLYFTSRREGVDMDGYALQENLPTLIQTLADVMQNATFPEDQLELSRQRALSQLRAELDDPQQLSWRVFRQTIYPADHPFHTFSTEESLLAITQADLVNFYRTHYRPDTTVLSLVGNFEPEAVKSLLSEAFGNWKAEGQRPSVPYPNVSLPQSMTQVDRTIPGKAEAVTFMGYNGGISRQDPRYYPALVMNEILGGSTLSSRLGIEIRDRQGLTYGIFSFFQAGLNPGPFAISMQTSPEDAAKAIESTLALLRQLREQGVTQAEIDTAKRSLTSSYPVDLSDPTVLASEILYNDVYGLSLEEIRQFPEKLEAVTSEQVQQAIDDLIHPENLLIVTAGPGNGGTIGG
ncbi:MAG: insulinase family protein [Cyanobacteria bacterium RU_5_0]|nr:insulinase family protein [Cyanobacteria bacterium RU_5_0]